MNTYLFRMAFLATGLALLSGCGVEATGTVSKPSAETDVTQPASLAGYPAAPEGWTFAQPVRGKGHLSMYRGQVISELDPIVLTEKRPQRR